MFELFEVPKFAKLKNNSIHFRTSSISKRSGQKTSIVSSALEKYVIFNNELSYFFFFYSNYVS